MMCQNVYSESYANIRSFDSPRQSCRKDDDGGWYEWILFCDGHCNRVRKVRSGDETCERHRELCYQCDTPAATTRLLPCLFRAFQHTPPTYTMHSLNFDAYLFVYIFGTDMIVRTRTHHVPSCFSAQTLRGVVSDRMQSRWDCPTYSATTTASHFCQRRSTLNSHNVVRGGRTKTQIALFKTCLFHLYTA